MVGFGSGSVQFDRIWIRPKGFELIRIRNTAYSPIKSMLSSVSREESGPSCSKKRAAVGCQEEPTKRACYRVSKKGWNQCGGSRTFWYGSGSHFSSWYGSRAGARSGSGAGSKICLGRESKNFVFQNLICSIVSIEHRHEQHCWYWA